MRMSAAEGGVAHAGAAVLDVPGQLAHEPLVAAGGDGHVVPSVAVLADHELGPAAGPQPHRELARVPVRVRDGDVRRVPRVRHYDPQAATGPEPRRDDLDPSGER